MTELSYDQVDLAAEVATRAHAGQFDKAGHPYILHPARVALRVRAIITKLSPTEQIMVQAAAWLHDVVEDTDVSLDDLLAEGIDERVTTIVTWLTHDVGVPYGEYIKEILISPYAPYVKAADIADNLDPDRLAHLDTATRDRLYAKYVPALALLEEMGVPTIQVASIE